jgi:hypothetical protein
VPIAVAPSGPKGEPGLTGTSFGWARWTDADRTQASPLNLPAGVRTQYVISSFGPLTENNLKSPFDSASMYDGTKFIAYRTDDTYLMRMRFFGTSSIMNNTVEIDLDIRNIPRTFITKRVPFHPSAGVTLPLEETFVAHVGSTFITNGARIYLTADNAAQIYDITLSITPLTTP